MAAISVDGRCRERNPPDVAIFGAEGDRLVGRFVDPGEGQALLARCTGEGTAEGTALLATTGGARRFRISLWRQRGGERIRILGAFAAVGADQAPGPGARGGSESPPPPHVLIAEALGAPVEAVLAIAARLRAALRAGPGEEDPGLARPVSALLGAGWRLRRLSDDLRTLEEMRTPRLPVRMAEVDAGRLLRRVIELGQAGGTLETVGIESALPAAGPLVMTDEAALWTLAELMLGHAAAAAAEVGAGSLILACPEEAHGAVIEIRAADAGRAEARAGPAPPDLRARQAALTEATGASVDLGRDADGLPLLRLRFPPARCLDP